MVRALLSGGASVDLQTTSYGLSPLHAACYCGHIEVVRALLSAGAKVDLPNEGGQSPLHMACLNGGHAEVVHTLLSWRAKVDMQDSNRMPPLQLACIKGYTEVVTCPQLREKKRERNGGGGCDFGAVSKAAGIQPSGCLVALFSRAPTSIMCASPCQTPTSHWRADQTGLTHPCLHPRQGCYGPREVGPTGLR